MKNKKIFFAIILLMAIGFAAVSTTLYINGTSIISTNEFDVLFTKAVIENGNADITGDGQNINFSTTLKSINQEETLNFEITNYSTQYSASGSIECGAYTTDSNSTENTTNFNDFLDVTASPVDFNIAAGKRSTGVITTKLKKVYAESSELEISIRCTLIMSAGELTVPGVEPSDKYILSGTLTDDNGNPRANETIAVYSTKSVTRTDANGHFEINGLEEGKHNIYILGSEVSIQEAEQMSDDYIKSNYDNITITTASTILDTADNTNIEFTMTIYNKIRMSDLADKYIYLDSENGNDTTGDGTASNPYRSFNKIYETGFITSEYSYAIVLKNGEYSITDSLFKLADNKGIHIIGNKAKTKLVANRFFTQRMMEGKTSYTVYFYRLYWKDTNTTNRTNTFSVKTPRYFYNIYFDIQTNNEYGYFLSENNGETMYNCVVPRKTYALMRTKRYGDSKVINSYGGYSSGYQTVQGSWDYATNYLTETPQIDEETYRITEDESVWKDKGTGTDPDGSIADIGLYGGTYSWDYEDDLKH